MIPTLRQYQDDNMNEARAAFRSGHSAVLYEAPTGSGKGMCIGYMASCAAKLGTHTGIVVHRVELLRQILRALDMFGVPYGVVHPDYQQRNELIMVGTVQTMIRRFIEPRKLLMLDEAHHAVARMWGDLMAAHPSAKVFGFTATPCRTNNSGRGLGDVFTYMVKGPTPRELMDSGFLCPATVYTPPLPGDMSGKGLKSRAGDYSPESLAALMDRSEITGKAIDHYRQYLDGRPSVAFCSTVEHAIHVAGEFRDAGYRSLAVYGAMPKNEREYAMDAFAGGDVDVLTSKDLISEGVDVPGIVGVINLRLTRSLGWHIQSMGRGLRVAPGKAEAIILDHAGNCLRNLHMPDTDHEWTLENGVVQRAKDDAPKIRQCAMCYFVHVWAVSCPKCGYVYEVKARKAVKEAAGELVVVSREEAVQMFKDVSRITARGERMRVLNVVARSMGKKGKAASGWAYVMANNSAARTSALARIEEAV